MLLVLKVVYLVRGEGGGRGGEGEGGRGGEGEGGREGTDGSRERERGREEGGGGGEGEIQEHLWPVLPQLTPCRRHLPELGGHPLGGRLPSSDGVHVPAAV